MRLRNSVASKIGYPTSIAFAIFLSFLFCLGMGSRGTTFWFLSFPGFLLFFASFKKDTLHSRVPRHGIGTPLGCPGFGGYAILSFHRAFFPFSNPLRQHGHASFSAITFSRELSCGPPRARRCLGFVLNPCVTPPPVPTKCGQRPNRPVRSRLRLNAGPVRWWRWVFSSAFAGLAGGLVGRFCAGKPFG